MPLQGVRVVDFSHVWAGPYCTRILGDMGAEIIKVESISRYDQERGPAQVAGSGPPGRYPDGDPGKRPYNRAARFNSYNRNKQGLTLDLRADDGLRLALELIAVSDVVVENFSTGVMQRLGLDYEDCRAVRPDVVYLTMSGFGRTGPEKGYVAFGITQEVMSGLSSITGYPGDMPTETGVMYGDPTGGVFGALAALSGLWHRRMTGEGQYVDLSQREAFTSLLPELLFEYTMNERVMEPMGNRHPEFAPHGCYRCQGEDSWVVITVTSEGQFDALCTATGHGDWANNPHFEDMASRKEHEDELDRVIQGWTEQSDSYQVMHLLQKAGVPAGAVLTNQQVLEDPHLNARGFFETSTHAEAGTHPYVGMPWKLSDTPAQTRLPAPRLGEHNDYVLGEVLGVPPEELERLAETSVIGTEPLSSSLHS